MQDYQRYQDLAKHTDWRFSKQLFDLLRRIQATENSLQRIEGINLARTLIRLKGDHAEDFNFDGPAYLSLRGPTKDKLRFHIGHREEGKWNWNPLIDFELWEILAYSAAIPEFYAAACCEHEVRKVWDVYLVNGAFERLNRSLNAAKRTSLTLHFKRGWKLDRDIQATLGKLEVLDLR